MEYFNNYSYLLTGTNFGRLDQYPKGDYLYGYYFKDISGLNVFSSFSIVSGGWLFKGKNNNVEYKLINTKLPEFGVDALSGISFSFAFQNSPSYNLPASSYCYEIGFDIYGEGAVYNQPLSSSEKISIPLESTYTTGQVLQSILNVLTGDNFSSLLEVTGYEINSETFVFGIKNTLPGKLMAPLSTINWYGSSGNTKLLLSTNYIVSGSTEPSTLNNTFSSGPIKNYFYSDYNNNLSIYYTNPLFCNTTISFVFSSFDTSTGEILGIDIDNGEQFKSIEFTFNELNYIKPISKVIELEYYPSEDIYKTYTTSLCVYKFDGTVNRIIIYSNIYQCSILKEFKESAILETRPIKNNSFLDTLFIMELKQKNIITNNILDTTIPIYALTAIEPKMLNEYTPIPHLTKIPPYQILDVVIPPTEPILPREAPNKNPY